MVVGIFDFLKRPKKESPSDIDESVTNNNQLSPIITNSQQEEAEIFSKRDLHYARRIGQIEEMSENISRIKDRLTSLDAKFDLRIPDKMLTEKRFEDEVIASKDLLDEIEAIRQSLGQLERAIINKQQLETITDIRKSTEIIETNLREVEIRRNLKGERLTTDELSKRLGLSRSRTNQLLLEMEGKGMTSRIKYGKKNLWTVT